MDSDDSDSSDSDSSYSDSSDYDPAYFIDEQFRNILDYDLHEEDAGAIIENLRTVSGQETGNTNSSNAVDNEPTSRQNEAGPVSLREIAATTSTHRERSPGGPPAKIQKTCADVADQTDPEDDGQTCSICLEAWSTSGEHRLVALKCGHIFGRSCVLRWLKRLRLEERKCPTCNTKASVRGMRCIYARRLIAADATEVDALKQQLETTKGEKASVDLEMENVKRMYVKDLTDMRTLKQQLEKTIGEKVSVELDMQNQQRTYKKKLKYMRALVKRLKSSGVERRADDTGALRVEKDLSVDLASD